MLQYSPVTFHRRGDVMENLAIGAVAPTTVNSSVRTREYLTGAEIERLMSAARSSSRHGHRDATMILIGYRHGLRASELCDLQCRRSSLRRAACTSVGPRTARRVSTPHAARRNTRPATPTTRTGGILARLHDRAGGADDAKGLPRAIRSDRGAGEDAVPSAPAHAASRVRLRPGQRRPRHPRASGLARPQEHSAHGALHRTCAGSVQGLLALEQPAPRPTPLMGNRFPYSGSGGATPLGREMKAPLSAFRSA